MSLLSSVLGFQHTVRTPVGYAPGITSALHLGYGSNSKITGNTITKSLDIIRDGATATVSSQIRNKEASGLIDLYSNLESTNKVISDGLSSASDIYQTITDNIEAIDEIVTAAEAGSYTAIELDEQQTIINELVTEIQDIFNNTKIDGKSVLDGTYTSTMITNTDGTARYDIDLTSVNIDISSTAALSLGDGASKGLDQISITTNTDFKSLGGANSPADTSDLADLDIFKNNAIRMGAKLQSSANRAPKELQKVVDKRTELLNEFFTTLNTTNGGKNSVVQDAGFFYHPSPLPITTAANYNGTLLGNIVGSGVQGASSNLASSLLP